MRSLLINTILLNQEHANYCSIHYNGLRDVTYQSWQGALSGAEVEKGYHSSLNVISKTACPNVINDCSGVSRIDACNLDQLTEAWLSEALSKGVRYVAHVIPDALPRQPFGKLRSKTRQQGTLEMEIFDNVDEALIWIAFKNEFEF